MNYLVRGGVVLFTQRAAVVKGQQGKMALRLMLSVAQDWHI